MDSEESDYNICGSSSSDHFQMVQTLNEGDEEELQMLASLRMEQDEDEYGSSSLSGPQIQQYNMNASTDSSPWTPVSMVCIPATPLLCFIVILQWIQPG